MHVLTRTLAGLAASAAAAVLALALAPMGSAATTGPAAYTDPAGDAKSAPDVTNVSVALDAASGGLRFEVALAGGEQLANNGGVFIALNADRNAATGDQAGTDYLLGVFADGAGLLKWDGKDMVAFNHQPLLVARSPGTVAVAFCSCDIGTQTFVFAVIGFRGSDLDVAPDAGGTFPIPERAISIQSFLYSPTPLLPKAGKRFTLKPLGIRLADTNEVVAPESVSCSATLSGKKLKGSGVGGCSWLLPKKTRGKKLIVTVNVSYQGQSETFSQTFKVR